MEVDSGVPRQLGDPRGRANRRQENGPQLTGGAKSIPQPFAGLEALGHKKTPHVRGA